MTRLFLLEKDEEAFALFYSDERAQHVAAQAGDSNVWRVVARDVTTTPCPWCVRVARFFNFELSAPSILDEEWFADGETECNDCRIALTGRRCRCGCRCLSGQVLGHPSFSVPGLFPDDDHREAPKHPMLSGAALLERFRASHGEPMRTLWRPGPGQSGYEAWIEVGRP